MEVASFPNPPEPNEQLWMPLQARPRSSRPSPVPQVSPQEKLSNFLQKLLRFGCTVTDVAMTLPLHPQPSEAGRLPMGSPALRSSLAGYHFGCAFGRFGTDLYRSIPAEIPPQKKEKKRGKDGGRGILPSEAGTPSTSSQGQLAARSLSRAES